jgi:hypothetical protein
MSYNVIDTRNVLTPTPVIVRGLYVYSNMTSFFRFLDKKRFNVNSAIFQEQVNFQWDDDDVRY